MDQSIYADPAGFNVLGGLFQMIVNDLKNGSAHWEDFIVKASKYHQQLRSTITASTAFLDSFQKIADMATTTRGGTKEIGTALTRLCLRQRSVEAKMKAFTAAIMDRLILPLQDRVEEWKKTTVALDKEHAKELKRLRHEFKKRNNDPSLTGSSNNGYGSNKKHHRMGSKGKYDLMDVINGKGIYGTIGGTLSKSSSLTRSLDQSEFTDCNNDRVLMFEELERNAVRRAMIEERSHFCFLVNFLRPVLEEEVAMIGEMSHIQEIMDSLFKLAMDPFDLPSSSELAISRLKLGKPGKSGKAGNALGFHTPPSSPSSLGSRKSSMCSISSYNSSSSGSGNYGQNTKHMSLTHIPGNFGLANYTSSPVFETMGSIINKDKKVNYPKPAELQIAFDSNMIAKSSTSSGTGKLAPSKSNAIKISSTNPFLDSYDEQQSNTVAEDNYLQIYKSNQPLASDAVSKASSMSSAQSDSNIYSEGSITPTNHEYKSIFSAPDTEPPCPPSSRASNVGSGCGKPPPAPPVRRTSSISNPNAITIGTLKSAGVGSNHEEIYKNFSLYDEINVLTKSMNDINYTLKNTDFSGTKETKAAVGSNSGTPQRKDSLPPTEQPLISSQHSSMEEASQLPLPAPPPEAFAETNNPVVHYNKIPNINLDFLATLNTKLSQSPLIYQQGNNKMMPTAATSSSSSMSSSSSRRRNSSQSSEPTTDKPRSAIRSSSTTRTSRKYFDNPPSVSQSYRENFLDRLSSSLLSKQNYHSSSTGTSPQQQQQQHYQYLPPQQQQQQVELAKAAASNALQRKQSVPDLNELGHRRVTFSSQLDLTSPTNSSSSSSAFQVVEIQTNSTQQPIYASRTQLQSEMQDLYGTLGRASGNPIYVASSTTNAPSTTHDASYQNGLFHKL